MPFVRPFPLPTLTLLAAVCSNAANAAAEPPAPTTVVTAAAAELPAVTVEGHYQNGLGSTEAASEGSVTARLIASRPTLRPAEVLEFVPGVIVTQHSGDGKANQYFLRGFNLDHGTDFATWLDGMPINMPTHAHGQGYSDLNWLIPELVGRIDYRKGPYRAEDGDFASAGSARIGLLDALQGPTGGLASATLGEHGYARALLAKSSAVAGGTLLYALESAHNDGPWQNPERFGRLNGVLRWSRESSTESGTDRISVTALGYGARWNSTDQIPARAVESGLVDRYGAIDPTDGGTTSRFSLSGNYEHRDADGGAWKASAYLIRSRIDLYSDFTYNLERPEPPANADQFEQAERRTVVGGALSRSLRSTFAGADATTTVGLQFRHDRLDPVGLYQALGRERVAPIQESTVRETSVGLWLENSTQWRPWLRSIVGLRHDRFRFDVDSSIEANAGRRDASLTSPKLGLVLGPWAQTELFANAGFGFHSNDARGVVATVSPKERQPVEGSPPLVRTKGWELGARTEPIPGWTTTLALWELRLGSELVFSGDAGDTEPSGASRRRGIELNQHMTATRWLRIDADLAVSRARFDTPQGDAPNDGRYVPGAVARVASIGATVSDLGRWSGHVQLRYFGPRPLIEDGSQRSAATTLAYLRVGVRLADDWKLALDVYNLFDRRASDIDYYYVSRLAGKAAEGVADRHFHPVEPRTFRVTLSTGF